jgi:hypothetical protein
MNQIHLKEEINVSNNKNDNDSENKGKVKVGNLRLNKETVKDLTDSESKQIKGGAIAISAARCSDPCPATKLLCPHATTVPAGCSPTVVKG